MAAVVRLAWTERDPPGALPEGEVHVWRASLSHPPSRLAKLEAELSSEERSRADLHCRPEDRARFVACRAALRRQLAVYAKASPAELRLGEEPGGKPVLRSPGPSVRFSVSHSGDLGLLAFAVNGQVGVDVERVRERADLHGIAARFFSPAECDALRDALDPTTAFLTIWTLKEAYLKATGEGLRGLGSVSVSLGPEGPALSIAGRRRNAHRGLVARSFVPTPGHVAGLVFTEPCAE
jgi:4'-phosphopantetheinyl transferase